MGFEIINKLKKEKGLTNETLADLSGVPKSTVAKIASGITKNPSLDALQAIAKVLGCSLDDFGDNKRDNAFTPEELSLVRKYRRLDDDGQYMVDTVIGIELERCERSAPMGKILYYDLPASAGTGNYLESEYPTYMEIPQEEIPHGADFAVRIAGDSMEPDFFDGDVVFVKRGEVRRGDVGIFVINDEGYIKELGDGVLISHNKKYADIEIGENDSQYILGKVVGRL